MSTFKHFVDCECQDPNHLIKFEAFYEDDEEPQLYIYTQLSQYRSFFKRLVESIKYLFKVEQNSGHWDTTIVDKQHANELYVLLHQYVKKTDKFQESNKVKK